MTRIRTLEFLPEIFQTPTNSQFLGATLDQLVNPPVTRKIEGFVGSKLGYGINANDYYVPEPTKTRKDYQLEPGVVFTKKNESVAQDFISYPGILDALKLQNGIVDNNDRLFNSQFYSWDSFTNLDALINYNQYYWLPEGPPAVTVGQSTVFLTDEFVVTDESNSYNIKRLGAAEGQDNTTITLLRGGTYEFIVNQNTNFWIQGEPGTSGYSPLQNNLYTRNIYGVTNNGADSGIVTFNVPEKNAQEEYIFPGNNFVSVVCDKPLAEINGYKLSQIGGSIDGLTALNGRTVLFYNTGEPDVTTFYQISYTGDTYDPTLVLTATTTIPLDEKITPIYGTEYINLDFYKSSTTGDILQVPYLSSQLDILYYQDETNPNKVGIIKLIDSNTTNTLNVETEILGKKTFTSSNGVVFTNGLKIVFDGDVVPASYLQGEYYVEGVGTSIELVPVLSLIVPETYTDQTSVPYDTLPYDIGNYDSNLYIPANQDYITIARNAKNRNAWARSNRWFHIDVIKATANYLDNPEILTTFANANNKAVRPIVEFYPNIQLFNSGTIAKNEVDFIDFRTTNAFDVVAGQATYYPDVETYTQYTGTINTNPVINTGSFISGQQYKILDLGTTSVQTWQDVGASLTYDGNFVPGLEYIITELGTTNWNDVAGTIAKTYVVGDIIIAKNQGTIIGAGSGTALTVLFTALNSGQYNSSELQVGKEYFISNLGTTTWTTLGAIERNVTNVLTPVTVSSLVVGKSYTITSLGTTTQEKWNQIAGTTGITYSVGSDFTCVAVGTGTGQAGTKYYIKALGNTLQSQWNTLAGTTNVTYKVGDIIIPKVTLSVGSGELIQRQMTATKAGIGTGSAAQGMGYTLSQTTTTISINATNVTGSFSVGMYISDLILGQQSRLPVNTRILSVSGTNTITMEVFWPIPTIVSSATGIASFVANTKSNSDLSLFSGARVVFAAEDNLSIKNKIYIVNFNRLANSYPVITLTEAFDGTVLENDQFVVIRGQVNQGNSFYFKNNNYILAQQKLDINVPPKFDVYDSNGISFGDPDIYESSTFIGSDLFRYKIGTGPNDSVLGFPISYSSINNIGDIRFEVALNTDTFNYVSGVNQNLPVTQNVNTGFVHYTTGRTSFDLLTGWQTAVAPSTQYQVFEFDYEPNVPAIGLDSGETITYKVTCDVSTLPIETTIWPNIQVFNNNNLLVQGTDYDVTFNADSTVVDVYLSIDSKTVIQVLLLSDQVSTEAYYTIPINLSNNPFNTDVTTVDIGDIRGHYQTIFDNNPDTLGIAFGANNTRDLGNLVPWGTRIIQNSASLVLPSAFLRNGNHNLFEALEFNSKEYIKFKTLLIDTVNKTSYEQKFDPAYILDDALDQIASVKNQDMPFFWSDMLPNKAPYVTNIYTLQNPLAQSIYPLSQIYDFTSANYSGVLIYVQTTVDGVTIVKQLYNNIDYVVSADSPSVTVTKDLIQGDKVIVKEYNQTYGSYVPNTPTKLGLYPVSIPAVVLDTSYNEPTYFIKGHDGSYTKLYGDYYPETNILVDYRDQALLEFETRIFNNLKLSNVIPIQDVDIVPGYFRNTSFSYDEWLQMYSSQFLNWIGQNRLDYKTQIYLNNNPWTYNYKNSQNRLDGSIINQGYWRGIYQYYYDTSTPNETPWEMIGYRNQPTWWEERYGPAPYTSDNLILWQDMENGIDWNNGEPVVIENFKRPGLLDILPVNSSGELLEPFYTIVGNYNSNTLQKDWMIGDDAPVEFSYRRSSTYPFDLMRLYALMKPANFFNLAVDMDNYKYDPVLNQFLFNGRSHLVPSEIQIYGNGTAKTSYINWIVDYEKQAGVGATEKIITLLDNLDVRLVYRLAGFSDKTLLKFFVEKGTPDSNNASLLIPDESYSILLYENQAYSRLSYSSVVVQLDTQGYRVYGNSQTIAYFSTLKPVYNNNTSTINIQDQQVKIANNYLDIVEYVPYGTLFYTAQEVSQFLMSYGKYLESQGVIFNQIESGIEVNWTQMIAEFLYWSQIGWETGSILTLNPAANTININKESTIVQPLTLQQTNFILNQNLYPINNKDLSIYRNGSDFKATVLNSGDTIAYAQFNLSNIEHGIVFDNTTLFNDVVYNLISGLKQNRIYVRGTKSAEWNGTMFASGFIYNQDNVQEWTGDIKYTKGSIVKYKNKFWTALKIIQAGSTFNELDWKETEYDEIQKGLLPNSSTRSAESALYYNSDKANLEQDADQLSFSLIGFRPRPYMVSADLTDITQVNVYKNMIKEKGTRNTLDAFRGAQLPQGGIDYNVYENWAILTGEFGGVLNNNFIEFKLNESKLSANPSIIGITNGNDVQGSQQLVPIYSLYNYGRPISNTNILPILPNNTPNLLYPEAGYVNVDDVKMSSYFYSNLPVAVDKNRLIVPIDRFYVNDYVWLADYLAKWQILTPFSIGQVTQVRSNLNGTSTVFFKQPHNLQQYNIFSIINFDTSVNGYYVAAQVINPYQVLINLNLNNNNRQITGQGIALGFNSHRVDKPSDIVNLSLLNYEFAKNKVWVDESTDGDWAVFRKSNNYEYSTEITTENTVNFGASVNYTTFGDFLIGDPGVGKVYRYQYDALINDFDSDQILNLGGTFGTTIASAENIIAISRPTSATANDRMVALYVVNNSYVTDDLLVYQNNNGSTAPVLPWIIAPSGCTNFGTGLAMSDDTNYLYISDFDESTPTARNKVHLYRKNNILTQAPFTVGQTYQITELGTTDFIEIGAVENKVGIYFIATGAGSGTGKAVQCNYQYVSTINGPDTSVDKFGYSLSTNNNGDILVVGAPDKDYNTNIVNWGKAYVYQKLSQSYEVQTQGTGQTFALSWIPTSSLISVFVNGIYLQASNYGLITDTLTINIQLKVGDIVTVKSNDLILVQTLESTVDPRTGVQFGTSVSTNNSGTEILVGSPFELNSSNQEGAVYRYTCGGASFGYVIGTSEVVVTAPRTLLLNGYKVTIPVGDAEDAATAINVANITNVEASATNNILTINLVNNQIGQVNQELIIGVTDKITLEELGLELFTGTQKILCPHAKGPTQFGSKIKFNEFNSVIISAPVGNRYSLTTFDFTDDENLDNDTIFDNNSTQFLDVFAGAGAVYMFDYLGNYNESLTNIGKYTYAQSCNAQNLTYGQQPYYGYAIDFNDNKVIIGTPYFESNQINGQAVVYINNTGEQNWSVYRQSNPVVDTSRIQNTQIFSAETNNTLINLDYMDPLQGKLLGVVAENIDITSNIDPATYNNVNNSQSGFVWGSSKVGSIWFDTTNVRFINYHQNDNVYNARYWGTLFPGSDVAIYSWVASTVPPVSYQGAGVPKDVNLYTVQTVINSSNQITPVYYFWVRNTGIIFPEKSLSDITLAEYIANPQNSGVSYFAPLTANAFALYNSQRYINANDSVLHIGYGTSDKDDVAHQEYCLVREDFASDFLPGFPNINKGVDYPQSLYDRMLDSLSGTDETGAVVPDPFLPKAVQSGVLPRPRQSFFYNRYLALKNYIQFVNSVLELYPIAELRRPTDLNRTGTYYNVPDYWEYINWWAIGYDNNTKAVIQVPFYADLSALNVSIGTIVSVTQNSQGLTETYIYDGDEVWTRIGLQNGTIKFKSTLYDYEEGMYGFGGDFFSTQPFDQYPSEETRWILRSINEQIFTNDLLIYRNQGLILLFEYIQSETLENQNYLPWLNKTSLVDVGHKIRELVPLENFTSDNQEFLSGYVNEAKPYHVVIKEFLFNYTGKDIYQGNITDFDVPASFDNSINAFVSPQLVYSNPNTAYEFLPNNSIWTTQEYSQWYNNYGVSLTGQNDYLITRLASYVTLSSNFIVVDNAQGFPINGVIKIASISNPSQFEYIGYNSVDRALNTLSGLVRGLNETEPFDHIPGENIFIDLPAIVVLNGGKGYTSTPKVTAYIDETLYPAPKQEAIFEAVMSLDKVVSINVIDPGQGYAVLPKIVIEPASTFDFSSSNVNVINNAIEIYAPILETGDLIRYVSGTEKIGGLIDGQLYYINVLDKIPSSLIALYNTAKDAMADTNRVQLYSVGSGTQGLEICARASAVSSSYPVRENNITLRYDRTTYQSQITDWAPNTFYSASFTGSYNNTENVSSSNIDLQSLNPNINNILASNGGLVFPIASVTNDQNIDWSLFERTSTTILAGNKIKLSYTSSEDDQYPSGSTVGFTVGMPIKFTGNTGTNITAGTTYYINEIVDLETFKISNSPSGSALTLTPTTSISMKCFTAKVTNTAVVSVDYPGIRNVTETQASTNTVKVPLNAIGTGGTQGLYTGISLLFTGVTLGGIEENVVYYVTSIIDDERFTLSENSNPLTLKVLSINGANQLILPSVVGLEVGTEIIFNTMVIEGEEVTEFGNIIFGQTYYVKEIGINVITISETLNGPEKSLDPVYENNNTYAFFTSQEDVLQLSDGSGSMTMNIQLPASPGQVNGQQFTLYKTSQQYANISSTNYGNLVEDTVQQILSSTNVLAIDNADRLYNGFPFTIQDAVGGLYTDRTYYITNLSNIIVQCDSSSVSSCTISATFVDFTMTVTAKTGSGLIYPGSVITGSGITSPVNVVSQISGTAGGTGVYQISSFFSGSTSLTGLTSSVGIINVTSDYSTNMIYTTMPIVFSEAGTEFGNIILNQQYYVRHIINSTSFIISTTYSGGSPTLVAGSGLLTATGSYGFQTYLKAGTFKVGDNYDINFIGTTNFAAIGATLAVNNTTGFVVGQKYIIQNLGTTTNTQWNVIAGTINKVYKVGDTFVAKRTSFRLGNGAAYLVRFTATGVGSGTGTAIVITSNSSVATNINQQIVETPVFDISYVLGGYRALITNGGIGFTTDNTITINGNLIGGTTPANNLVLTVNQINSITEGDFVWATPITSDGTITSVICSGEPSTISNKYFLKVKDANTFEVYEDQLMQVPVSGINFPYDGFTTTTATSIIASTDTIVVGSSTSFNINDPVVFTGNIFSNEIILGKTYYIYDKPSTVSVRLTTDPGGSLYTFGSNATGTMTMGKQGSFALLPQPFYFNESIVKYNNRVYVCVVSNHDSEFVFGKWEELNSGDLRLNAMDRVKGYYAPTINMPAAELPQLFTGVTYPNTTYLGNDFNPANQFNVDTNLQDQVFYPKNVNLIGAIYNQNYYMFVANLPNYSALISDVEVADNWMLRKLSDKPLSLTNFFKLNDKYIITSSNTATPLLISNNGNTYSTNGYYVPIGTSTEDIPYVQTKLISNNLRFNAVAYGNGKYVAVGSNISVSSNLSLWKETYTFGTSAGELTDVKYISNSFFTGFVAVGYKTTSKIVLYSTDGETWTQVPAGSFSYGGATVPQQNATLRSITFNTNSIVVVGDLGVIYKATAMNTWVLVQVAGKPLNAVLFNNSIFVTVGDTGYLYKSTDGTTWTLVSTPTTENLNAINYESTNSTWTVVGNNNTVIQTLDISASPVVWDTTQVFTTPVPAYTIQGDSFQSGYGPEELVPGVITDQLTMIVTTRPGTNWSVSEYANDGYDVVSLELSANGDNVYSFASAVATPIQIAVFKVTDGLSTSIYKDTDYTVDWVEKTVTLTVNITSPSQLRIDVYEAGNGDQLIKSNTDNIPIINNDDTGFDEIYLNCPYSASRFNGGGLIKPTTVPIDDIATKTDGTTEEITVQDISNFYLNAPISFAGSVFGGVSENTSYYVKSINLVRSTITISSSLTSGIAGPTFNLSSATGSMVVIINAGPGTFYTEPAVYFNGDKLLSGKTNYIIRTIASNNALVTYSTVGLLEGETITFDDNIIGGLTPHQTYYIKTIINSTEFTVSSTLGGSTVTVTNAVGTSIYITNDYAAASTEASTAKIIFADTYDTSTDYLAFSFLSETEPEQYGYTLPETQVITGTGASVYSLTNYLGGSNSTNAIVEIDGLRIMPDQYAISSSLKNITFSSAPTSSQKIAVTTFNDTSRQYLNTQYGSSTIQVTPISFVQNNIALTTNNTVEVTTSIPHGLATNDIVRIDGIQGSYQLDNTLFIINVLSITKFEIYEYIPGYTYEYSVPITNVNTYTSGGYVWKAFSWVLQTTTATASSGTYITVNSSASLVVGTPVIFTEVNIPLGFSTSISEIIAGQVYYISSIAGSNITISSTRDGENLILSTTTSKNIRVTQWEQYNVDRLWVTVNGKRVESSLLKLNEANELSILIPIVIGDKVIITSMVPSPTPNEMVYINTVDDKGVGSVYRANSETRTWLSEAVSEFDTTITVNDTTNITNRNEQTDITTAAVLGYHVIALDATKDDIIDITVYNNNPARLGFIDEDYIQLEVTGTGPYVKITAGSWIQTGDILTIVTLEGKLLYINGEYMRVNSINPTTKVCEVARGVNGTSIQVYIPKYTTVYSLLQDNRMSQASYNDTWNKVPGIYNITLGDPLQIATGSAPNFLRVDN